MLVMFWCVIVIVQYKATILFVFIHCLVLFVPLQLIDKLNTDTELGTIMADYESVRHYCIVCYL